MTGYVVKRLLFSVMVLLFISIIVFSAVRAIPGNVCAIVLATPDIDKQQCQAIDAELGLDKPMVVQYFSYIGGILTGDWGKGLIDRRDVWGEIQNRIPLTVELTLLSSGFAILIAIPIGVISAVRQDGPLDYVLRFVTIGWLSIPSF